MRKVILVVEDNPVFRRALERLLIAEGYVPETYGCAEDAMDALITCDFDMALLDVRLPGMSGDELANLLKQRCAWKPIAFVTSDLNRDSRLGRQIPGCRIVRKPVDVPGLLEMLHEMVPV